MQLRLLDVLRSCKQDILELLPPDEKIECLKMWSYRPGRQLLISIDGEWREASVLNRQPDGKHEIITSNREQEIVKKIVELTADNHVLSARVRFEKGDRVTLFDHDDGWQDATIEAVADGIHTARLDSERGTVELMPNLFNIAPLLMPLDEYALALRKYRAFVITRHSFVTDALTGERLDIEDQCVPVKLTDGSSESGGTGSNTHEPAEFYVTVPSRASWNASHEFPVIANGQELMVR